MTFKKQAISGVKWTTLSTVIVALSNLLKVSILARYLEKSDFGLMALVMFVLGFMNLFIESGIPTAILHKKEITKQEYSSLYWLNLAISFLLYLLVLAATPLVATFYNLQELNKLIPIMGLTLIISAVGHQFKTIQQKNMHFQFISLVELTAALLSMLLAWYLAINDWGIYSLVYSTLLQFALSNLIFFAIGMKSGNIGLHFKYSETRFFLKIGVFQVGGQVTNYMNKDLDVLIIGKLFDLDTLGGYTLAKQLVSRPAQIITPVVSRVAAPVLAKFQNNSKILRESYLKLVNIVATINVPVYLIIILFSPFIVRIIYGADYINITLLVHFLSVHMLFRSFSNPMGSLVIATGRTDLAFSWNLVILPVTPIAVLIGAQFSIEMVALSLSLTTILLFVPGWWFMVRRMIGVRLIDYVLTIVPFYRLSRNDLIKSN